jgi:hypothetical protein
MTPTQKKLALSIVNSAKILRYFGYLQDRWADEKKYEKIEDYAVALGKHMPSGVKVVRMTKRPFAAHVQFADKSMWELKLRNKGRGLWVLAIRGIPEKKSARVYRDPRHDIGACF